MTKVTPKDGDANIVHGIIDINIKTIYFLIGALGLLNIYVNAKMHKHHIFWLTPNIVSIIGGVGLSYFVSTLVAYDQNVKFWNNFLSAEFIYQWLLPLIVIGEGFTLGNTVWSFLSSKWKLLLIPLSIIIGVQLIHGALYLCTTYIPFPNAKLFTGDDHYSGGQKMGQGLLFQFIALPMQFQNLHEILGVLHVEHNDFVYSQLTQWTYIGNNFCLVYLAIIEYFVQAQSVISNDWFVTILYAGFCSCFFGMFMGQIQCKALQNLSKVDKDNTSFNSCCLILLFALVTYFLCHVSFIRLSGDVAIIFISLSIKYFGLYNLSAIDAKKVQGFVMFMLEMAESISYIALGWFNKRFFLNFARYIDVFGVLTLSFISAKIAQLMINTICVQFVKKFWSKKAHQWKLSGAQSRFFMDIHGESVSEEGCNRLFEVTAEQYVETWPVVIVSGTIKGPQSIATLGLLLHQNHNFGHIIDNGRLYIIMTQIFFTPLYYFITKCLLKRIPKIPGLFCMMREFNQLKFSWDDFNIKVDPENPKTTDYINQFGVSPAQIYNYRKRHNEILETEHELFEEMEKLEGVIGSDDEHEEHGHHEADGDHTDNLKKDVVNLDHTQESIDEFGNFDEKAEETDKENLKKFLLVQDEKIKRKTKNNFKRIKAPDHSVTGETLNNVCRLILPKKSNRSTFWSYGNRDTLTINEAKQAKKASNEELPKNKSIELSSLPEEGKL